MDKTEQTARRGLKLCQGMFGLDIRKNLFPEKGDSILEWAARARVEGPQWEMAWKGKPGWGTQCHAPVAMVGLGHRLDANRALAR